VIRQRRLRPSRALLAAAALAAAGLVAACEPGQSEPYVLRQWTEDMILRISSDPSPPRARETIVYKVVVSDKKTGQPIEGGEGRIFASSRDGAKTWYPLEPGPELGTDYGRLRYITAGDWAVAIEFRRDSTKKLERMDWRQDVGAERATNP
jgi:hypothetical protein